MNLSELLPLIYAEKLPASIQDLNIDETEATCGSCVMAPEVYSANIKCCTFYPFIPNYAVGAILDDPDSEGAERVKSLILEKRYALPLGIVAPPDYQWKHQNKAANEFGNREDLLCPFYQEGEHNCSVWAARGSECSTFFCKSSYGDDGENFWLAVREYLHDVEMALSQDMMVQKGYTNTEIEKNLNMVRIPLAGEAEVKKTEVSMEEWSGYWIHHSDQIEAYYLDCYERFARLEEEDIDAMLDSQRAKEEVQSTGHLLEG